MKVIKKVSVTPVTPNTGDIIDSFSTLDDKTTNAPSINAVETKLLDYKLNGDFAVLTGSVASTDDSGTINYPTGFTKSNCVVISCMTRYSTTSSVVGYTNGSILKSSDGTFGSNPTRITLRDDDILIYVRGFITITNMNDETYVAAQPGHDEVQYKIVLMKVS